LAMALDYSVNVMHPDRFGDIRQRNGPSIDALPEQGREQILKDFEHCMNSGDPQLVEKYARQRRYSCLALFVFALSTALALLIAFAFPDLRGVGLVVLLLMGFAVALAIQCCAYSRKIAIREQWGADVVSNLRERMTAWKQTWPALTYSIICPVEVWSGGGRSGRHLEAIWCHVRVSQGPCVQGHNEPIFATTPQTQVVQQPQTVMVQPIEGQHVIVVQQQQLQPQTEPEVIVHRQQFGHQYTSVAQTGTYQ